MPCHVDPPTPTEYAQKNEVTDQLNELKAKAGHGADMLREYLLGNIAAERVLQHLNLPLVDQFDKLEALDRTHWLHVSANLVEEVHGLITRYDELNSFATLEGPEKLTGKKRDQIEKEQVKHRKADLVRLIKTLAFTEKDEDMSRLRACLDADPAKPLAAQLGFDPDEF